MSRWSAVTLLLTQRTALGYAYISWDVEDSIRGENKNPSPFATRDQHGHCPMRVKGYKLFDNFYRGTPQSGDCPQERCESREAQQPCRGCRDPVWGGRREF